MELRKLLAVTSAGSDKVAFGKDTLALLIRPEMSAYKELKGAVFGD